MKTTGVAVTVPTIELNLSNEFPNETHSKIAIAMRAARYRLMSQSFLLDDFIDLKT
jgi:hypothetical protein